MVIGDGYRERKLYIQPWPELAVKFVIPACRTMFNLSFPVDACHALTLPGDAHSGRAPCDSEASFPPVPSPSKSCPPASEFEAGFHSRSQAHWWSIMYLTTHILEPSLTSRLSSENTVAPRSIFEFLWDRHVKDQVFDVKYSYNIFRGSPVTASAAGWVFELRMHQLLIQGNPIELFPLGLCRTTNNKKFDIWVCSIVPLVRMIHQQTLQTVCFSIFSTYLGLLSTICHYIT